MKFLISSDNRIVLMWGNDNGRNTYSSVMSEANTISLNQWYHIAVNFSNSILKIYVNGKEVKSTMSYSNQGGSFISNAYVNSQVNFSQDINSSRIGVVTTSGVNDGYYNGKIDEFRVYDRALTEAEISYLYNQDTTKPPTPDISDIDGNKYKTVRIGDQVWMAENLKTTRFQNGDLIPEVKPASDWISQTKAAFVYYNNNEQNNTQFGKLYNWYTAIDNRNVCPVDWHVPSESDWSKLRTYLGEDIAGSKLKSTGTSIWASPNIATNETGFSALPNGCRCNDHGDFGGGPQAPNKGLGAVFLSTSDKPEVLYYGQHPAVLTQIDNTSTKLDIGTNLKYYGVGIRCVKDQDTIKPPTP
jgi:uncharacterized protein (TIGR02145 family)